MLVIVIVNIIVLEVSVFFVHVQLITFVAVTVYVIVLEASVFLLIYSSVITLVIIIANVTMIEAS